VRKLAALAAFCSVLIVSAGASAGSLDTPRHERAIVRAWSARLNSGDNKGVARLFALPAVITQGPFVYKLASRKDIALWHSTLPCAGKVVSITVRGRFATGVFRLANRGTIACDAPGSLAAALFEIRKGKIVSWTQVPVPSQGSSGTVTG
jgi:hypothetical protein